ncbi:MAG: phytoene/squalene synthase family protein [Sphingobacteriales bacterium]|nr:MAG: phytoene/squalene synthase family protein [Sphingobacteriales bacterium]TAF80005.1 MAG: phytoene/squalene synthase family protein [Sphingobacteriales bacterium]
MDLYTQTCLQCSKIITNKYSTSFSAGIKAFGKNLRLPIYAIYAYVRFADEIVDTFHNQDKQALIAQFKADTYTSIANKISLNPVLHSFQTVVNQYQIPNALIDAFLTSMEMDLDKTAYNKSGYQEYIYGSAEVIGLMCLKIFCNGDEIKYQNLLPQAKSLGAAFQKINFLRDIKSDFEDRGRTYFPNVDFLNFTHFDKKIIENDIQKDFNDALMGIKKLPKSSQKGVYIAYMYYVALFEKIKKLSANTISQKRIRVNNTHKIILMLRASLKIKLNFL